MIPILVVRSRSEFTASPPLDVLSGTGSTVGWLGMYDSFVSRKIFSAFDNRFSVVGELECPDRPWLLSGQTRTAPSPYPSALALAIPCPPLTPAPRVLPRFSNPRAMYEVHHSKVMESCLIDLLPCIQVTGSTPKFAFSMPVSGHASPLNSGPLRFRPF